LAIAVIQKDKSKQGHCALPRRQQSLTNEKVFILPEIKKSGSNQTETKNLTPEIN